MIHKFFFKFDFRAPRRGESALSPIPVNPLIQLKNNDLWAVQKMHIQQLCMVDLDLKKPLYLGRVTLFPGKKLLVHSHFYQRELEAFIEFAALSKSIRTITGSPQIDMTLAPILKALLLEEDEELNEEIKEFLQGKSLPEDKLFSGFERIAPHSFSSKKPLELFHLLEKIGKKLKLPSPLCKLEAAALLYSEEELLKRLEKATLLLEYEKTRALQKVEEGFQMLKHHIKERRPLPETSRFLKSCLMPIERDGKIIPLRDLFC